MAARSRNRANLLSVYLKRKEIETVRSFANDLIDVDLDARFRLSIFPPSGLKVLPIFE